MSRVIFLNNTFAPLNQIHISSVGNIIIDIGTGDNYAINDMSMTLLNVNALAAGSCLLAFQIGALQVGIGGLLFPLLTYGTFPQATAAGVINEGGNVVRTFPSAVVMPPNCQLCVSVTALTNLLAANILVDITGFTF